MVHLWRYVLMRALYDTRLARLALRSLQSEAQRFYLLHFLPPIIVNKRLRERPFSRLKRASTD